MRLLLINSVYGIGSTGRICARISKKAQKNGDICMVGCRESKTTPDDNTSIVLIGSRYDMLVHAALSRIFDDQGLHSVNATKCFIKKAEEFNPDVLWLHNIHGYYLNYELLFNWIKSRKEMKVKWTLHDCWAFTGHCAYFTMNACEKWIYGCFNCPNINEYPKSFLFDNSKRNYLSKKKAFCGINNLTIISPSKWLAELVGKSFLSEYPIIVKYNKIDNSVFKPIKSNFKERYGLKDKILVLGVANFWGKRKGLDRFVELSRKLPPNYALLLVGNISKAQKQELPSSIILYGKTNTANELAEIYSAADVFMCLSREDNFPTVNIEAEACGTRVITMNVGGCSETITRPDSIAVNTMDEVFYNLLNRK